MPKMNMYNNGNVPYELLIRKKYSNYKFREISSQIRTCCSTTYYIK